jgi:hypothetical protein
MYTGIVTEYPNIVELVSAQNNPSFPVIMWQDAAQNEE